jgi:hypothetical protein
VYDENAPKLAGMGYFPIPVAPANVTYVAKKSPVVFDPYDNRYINLADWNTMATPVTSPQPGANIGVRCGNGIVALDYDDNDAALIISEAFPNTPVNKEGQRGWTAFYRADFDVPSQNFYDANGKKVLEVLSAGKQTVIPPSVHPDTKQPYKWTNGHSLYDTPPSELPLLPRDYRERILALGYAPQQKPRVEEKFDPETGEIQNGFGDNPCAELNAAALSNLPAWVLALLPDAKRRKGRYAAYDAVNPARPSTTGRPYEQRRRNLGIVSTGIKDFGTGKSYSPLDLWMDVRQCSLAEAFEQLEPLVLKKPDIAVDWEKIAETQDAPKIAPEDDAPDNDDAAREPGGDPRLKTLGRIWRDGDPVRRPQKMLIPVVLPDIPFWGLFLGQRSTYKSFLLNSVAVALASGGTFAGQQVCRAGFVVQIEFEGSLSEVRIAACKKDGGIVKRLPIAVLTDLPPTVLLNRKENPAWRAWAADLISLAKDEAKAWGLPLNGITFDPMNKFAGFMDEDDSAEGNAFGRAMDKLAFKAGCPVIIADHLGKNASMGARGTSTKEQNAYFIWDVGERPKVIGETRQFAVTKMKNGIDGVGIKFHMKPIEGVEFMQEGEVVPADLVQGRADTLVVEWEGTEFVPIAEIDDTDLTDNELIAMKHLARMCVSDPADIPDGRAVPGLKGTSLAAWQNRVTRSIWGNTTLKSNTEMLKLQKTLQRKDKVDTDGDVVWAA